MIEWPHCAFITPLVEHFGRFSAWQQVLNAWRHVNNGSGSHVVLITGDAGMGKTRLAAELATWTARQGIATAVARCYPAEGRPAYAPLVAWLHTPPLQQALAQVVKDNRPLSVNCCRQDGWPPMLRRAAYRAVPPPTMIGPSILCRPEYRCCWKLVYTLAPATQEVIALTTVIGREFTFDLLTTISNMADATVIHALDEAWRRRIIREKDVNQYRFSHDKLRQVACVQIEPDPSPLVTGSDCACFGVATYIHRVTFSPFDTATIAVQRNARRIAPNIQRFPS